MSPSKTPIESPSKSPTTSQPTKSPKTSTPSTSPTKMVIKLFESRFYYVHQGTSVSLSGDGNTVVFGSPRALSGSSFGGSFVYVKSGSSWIRQGPILVGTGYGFMESPQEGTAMAISGNTIAVAGKGIDSFNGGVWIHFRTGTTWALQTSTYLSGTGGVGVEQNQGSSIALSRLNGNTLVVGANNDNSGIGAFYIFVRSGTTWAQQGGKLTVSGAIGNPSVGSSVAISGDGNIVAIGGPNDNSGKGAVWVFTRSGTIWSQEAKVVGTGEIGQSSQGFSVAISYDGNTIAIGAPTDDFASKLGAVWVFIKSGISWVQQAKLVGTGGVVVSGINIRHGTSVSLSSNGDVLAFGSSGDNNKIGAVWVFVRNSGTWSQSGNKLTASDTIGSAELGSVLSMSEDGLSIAAGGLYDDANLFGTAQGAVWIFAR
jgi:hypothetical protein